MHRRFLAALGFVSTVACFVAVPVESSLASSVVYRDVLTAGQHLRYDNNPAQPGSTLQSQSGAFALEVTGTSMMIMENEQYPSGGPGVGTATWWQFATKGYNSNDHSTLTMQRNGNLVLRGSGGRVIWSSHTSGYGNWARMQDDGNLVVRNGRGARIWSSHTTRVLMLAGMRLGAGRTFVNRYRQRWVTPTFLTMTRSGDLVVRWGTTRTWHSDTHVAGSHLLVTRAGRAAIVTPKGAVVWRSPSVGARPILQVDQCGRLMMVADMPSRATWAPTRHQPQSCG